MKLKSILTVSLLIFVCASGAYLLWGAVHTGASKGTSADTVNPSLPGPAPGPASAKGSAPQDSRVVNAAGEQALASGPSRTSEAPAGKTEEPTGSPAQEAPAPKTPTQKVIAYYFHGTNRCPTCLKMEAYSAEAVGSTFSNALERGDLEWRVVNTDAPDNKHFVNDYQLYTRSLVIVKMRDGKQIEWKNLEKIWDLVNDKDGFIKYVQGEISAYLGEGQ